MKETIQANGLHAIDGMQLRIEQSPAYFANANQLATLLTSLSRFRRIHELIESFWLEPGHRSVKTWQEHMDINSIMLATSLAPDGYLQLQKTWLRAVSGHL